AELEQLLDPRRRVGHAAIIHRFDAQAMAPRHLGHGDDLGTPRLAFLAMGKHDVLLAHSNSSPGSFVNGPRSVAAGAGRWLKSKRVGSARCEGTTLRRLEKMDSVR